MAAAGAAPGASVQLASSVRERTEVVGLPAMLVDGAAELGVGCPLVSGVVRDLRLGCGPDVAPRSSGRSRCGASPCCWFLRGGQWAREEGEHAEPDQGDVDAALAAWSSDQRARVPGPTRGQPVSLAARH
jgi:hypothetical protein